MPASLTDEEVVTALAGDEHGCAFDKGFTLAVGRHARHHHLHDHGYANRSGLSFGGVQLDVANNPQGALAFREMLVHGVERGALTPAEAAHYFKYVGAKRPDLSRELGHHVERDLRDLNAKLYFNPATRDGVKAISDRYQRAYVSGEVTPRMNAFLAEHADQPLFRRDHPDFHVAASDMLSRLNRGGPRAFEASSRRVAASGPGLTLARLAGLLGKGVDPALAAVGGSDMRDLDRAIETGWAGPIPRTACRPRPARQVASLGR